MGVFHNGGLLCPCHAPVYSRLQNVFLQCEEGLKFMARFLHPIDSFTIRKKRQLLLAFSWILGLGAGALAFRYAGDILVSLMPLAVHSQLSIVSLLLSISLPFLLSAFAVFISCPGLWLVVGFGKAFAYSYLVCGVLACFGSAGWLIRWLLLFTDSCSAALLYGYAARFVPGLQVFSPAGLLGCLTVVALLVGIDYVYFSPLLQALLL